MRLGTSTNLFGNKRDGGKYTIKESVAECGKYGYKVLDANFCHTITVDDFLEPADWHKYIYEIRELAESTGLVFAQSHIPFFNVLDPSYEDREHSEEMARRAIEASSILGVKWAVMHPGTCNDEEGGVKASLKRNLDYFAPYVELVVSCGVGIAIENMFDQPQSAIKQRFGSQVHELCELINGFNDPAVGVCWDFGHAHLMSLDQPTSLHTLGKRLKATHVDDNRGLADDHLVPLLGDVRWEEIMPVLREIEFDGDFVYEIHSLTSRLPADTREHAIKFSLDIGNYLLSLVNEPVSTERK